VSQAPFVEFFQYSLDIRLTSCHTSHRAAWRSENIMKTVYHRDHTVTVWNIYAQCWARMASVPDHILATLNDRERARIKRHTGVAR
jgi:hypothetical protein